MARTPKKSARERELEAELAAMRATVNAAALGAARMNAHQRTISELWVGIRNISDLTIGVKSPFPNEPDLHLHANFGDPDPGTVAVISLAWWLQLRKHKFVANGMILRDDRVLGDSYAPAPADRPEDLPATALLNQIEDPVAWIESRSEVQLRTDIAALTSTASLYRLRRAVDQRLQQLQSPYALDDEQRATKAYRELPALYQMVDMLTSQRLDAALV